MAKRKTPQTIKSTAPDEVKLHTFDASNLTAKTPLSANPPLYSNYVQINCNPNEFTLDFYELSPKPGGGGEGAMRHLERIFIPAGLAKGLASAVANLIVIVERDTGVILPNSRGTNEGDVIQIWK